LDREALTKYSQSFASIGRLADTFAGAPTEFFCGTGSNFVAASGRHMLLLCLMRGALPLPAQPELA
jgi:hypothetical protein